MELFILKKLMIMFCIIFVNTLLIIYFLNKDYKINWRSKKVFTYSRFSNLARIFAIANIVIANELLSIIYNMYFEQNFNETIDNIVKWLVIPAFCIFVFISVFYSTYSVFLFKQENKIK